MDMATFKDYDNIKLDDIISDIERQTRGTVTRKQTKPSNVVVNVKSVKPKKVNKPTVDIDKHYEHVIHIYTQLSKGNYRKLTREDMIPKKQTPKEKEPEKPTTQPTKVEQAVKQEETPTPHEKEATKVPEVKTDTDKSNGITTIKIDIG